MKVSTSNFSHCPNGRMSSSECTVCKIMHRTFQNMLTGCGTIRSCSVLNVDHRIGIPYDDLFLFWERYSTGRETPFHDGVRLWEWNTWIRDQNKDSGWTCSSICRRASEKHSKWPKSYFTGLGQLLRAMLLPILTQMLLMHLNTKRYRTNSPSSRIRLGPEHRPLSYTWR